MDKNECVVVMSGGLDSTVLMYWARSQGYAPLGVSFNYGQRHRKELEYARNTCARLGVEWACVDLLNLAPLLQSALTSPGVAVPEGHYAADNMKATVVPNRNAIMLSIAFGVAASRQARAVALGVHAGDHPIYPDCRPEFVSAFHTMQEYALAGMTGDHTIALLSPFVTLAKADIVKIGHDLGVRFSETWSCYKGDTVHCGVCGTCVERYEAFKLAGIADPTVYRDDPRVHLQEAS